MQGCAVEAVFWQLTPPLPDDGDGDNPLSAPNGDDPLPADADGDNPLPAARSSPVQLSTQLATPWLTRILQS